MMVKCIPGIKTHQIHRVMDNRDLGTSDIVVIHVGTSDLKRSVNLDYVMGEVYSLVNTTNLNFHNTKLY
jgi:hypothetical protein